MSGIFDAVGSIFTGPKQAPVPDYAAAAEKTQQANMDMARYSTNANRPTQVTPWGTSTWDKTYAFDQNAYDKAYADWENSWVAPTQGRYVQSGPGGDQGYESVWQPGSGGYYAMDKPNKEDFQGEEQWTNTTTLDPELQAALDNEIALQKGRSNIALDMLPNARDQITAPINYDSFQQYGSAPDVASLQNMGAAPSLRTEFSREGVPDLPQFNQQYVQDITNQTLDYMRPEMQAAQESLDAQLAAQGIAPGSEAYERAQRRLADQQSRDEYNAVRLGMDQANSMFRNDLATNNQAFNQNLSAFNFGNNSKVAQNELNAQNTAFNNANNVMNYEQRMANTAFDNNLRNTQITEAENRQRNALNNINALMSGQQVNMPDMPAFNTMSTPQGANYLNAANMQYKGDLNNANLTNAYNSNMLGGFMDFAGSGTGQKLAGKLFGF